MSDTGSIAMIDVVLRETEALLAHLHFLSGSKTLTEVKQEEDRLRRISTDEQFGRYLIMLSVRLAAAGHKVEALSTLLRRDSEFLLSPRGSAEARIAMADMFYWHGAYPEATKMLAEATKLIAGDASRRGARLRHLIAERLETISRVTMPPLNPQEEQNL